MTEIVTNRKGKLSFSQKHTQMFVYLGEFYLVTPFHCCVYCLSQNIILTKWMTVHGFTINTLNINKWENSPLAQELTG